MSRTSSQSDFVSICTLDDLPPYTPHTFELGDRFVVVVRFDDGIFCVDDICTHDGGTLGDGLIEDHLIVCSRHGAKFDLRTGDAVCMPATEPTKRHETKVEDGRVWIKLNE